jgi:hypothetical protein
MDSTIKFEVKLPSRWVSVSEGEVQPDGTLSYKFEGNKFIAQKGDWRKDVPAHGYFSLSLTKKNGVVTIWRTPGGRQIACNEVAFPSDPKSGYIGGPVIQDINDFQDLGEVTDIVDIINLKVCPICYEPVRSLSSHFSEQTDSTHIIAHVHEL